jgi:hypothetical protein
MKFPSQQFYDGQLTIGCASQAKPSALGIWPSGNNEPIAFVNVVGLEQTLTVSSEEGSEQSKSNIQEIDVVVYFQKSFLA